MPEYNNEATSLNFSIRRFLVVLLVPLIFIFCFNGVEVEVVSNSHADFHQYSENSVSPGTSYYDDGAVQPFASAWNSLAKNIARMLGYTHLISDNTNTTNSYIATLYTYLSNNLPGQWQTLSDIKTNTANSAAADQAALTFLSDLESITWTTGNSLVNITDPNGNVISQGSSIAPPYCDFHFGTYNSSIDAVYKFSLAISAYSYRTINTFIDHVEVLNSTADFEPIIVNHYYTGQNAIVNVVFSNLNTNTRDLILRVYLNDYGYASRTDSYMYYITSNNIDYYSVSDNALLRGILEKDFTAEIDGSDITVNINDSINVTPIELDVSIGIEDFTTVNTVSNKLRTWLSTGVGVSALIAALDQLDDSFFTLYNRSVIETINNQYTDFYD